MRIILEKPNYHAIVNGKSKAYRTLEKARATGGAVYAWDFETDEFLEV